MESPSIVRDSMARQIKNLKLALGAVIILLMLSFGYSMWSAQVISSANKEIKIYKRIAVVLDGKIDAQNKKIKELENRKLTVINNYYTLKPKPQEIVLSVVEDGSINILSSDPNVTVKEVIQ